jgi:hypothetical protein
MHEGFSRSGRLLICRVVQSADVRVLNGKLIVKDTRGTHAAGFCFLLLQW